MFSIMKQSGNSKFLLSLHSSHPKHNSCKRNESWPWKQQTTEVLNLQNIHESQLLACIQSVSQCEWLHLEVTYFAKNKTKEKSFSCSRWITTKKLSQPQQVCQLHYCSTTLHAENRRVQWNEAGSASFSFRQLLYMLTQCSEPNIFFKQ